MVIKGFRIYLAFGLAAVLLVTAGLSAETGQSAAADQPKNPAAGRVLTLTPVLTITDENSSDFYFKRPSQPKFGPDGSIYILDEKQILRFDAQGRFVRNYFRPGQGPGEVGFVPDYAPTGAGLVVYNAYPGKIIRFDDKGTFIGETPTASLGASLLFVHADEQRALFIKMTSRDRQVIDEMKGMEATLENQNPILVIPIQGGPEKAVGSFTTRTFVRKAKEGGAGMVPLGKHLVAAWGTDLLAYADAEEYAVKIVDLASGSPVRTIRRDYPRVKRPPEEQAGIKSGVLIGNEPVIAPAGKFAPDVVHLLPHGNELWVVTSTRVKGKGDLVDVFDRNGVYTDSFYLPVPVWPEKHLSRPDPIALQGDFLLCLEKTEEGTYLLRKYRIGK